MTLCKMMHCYEKFYKIFNTYRICDSNLSYNSFSFALKYLIEQNGNNVLHIVPFPIGRFCKKKASAMNIHTCIFHFGT